MYFLYNFCFTLILLLCSPYFLYKFFVLGGKESLAMRLAIFPPQILEKLNKNKWIWIHAASVGEVRLSFGLIEFFKRSGYKILVTTLTTTGKNLASSKADVSILLPIDILVKRFINKINFKILIILETEIWPNLLKYSKKKSKIIVLNGRISDKSWRIYSKIKFFLKKVLSFVDLFAMCSQKDALRIKELGACSEKIKITGNMKYDLINLSQIQQNKDKLLLVCGSTHYPEEEIILRIYKKLKKDFPNLKLVLAPRYVERAKEIKEICLKNKLNLDEIIIVDKIGKLNDFYAHGTVAFVGGSLIKKGGHNLLEPASFGIPVFFGPYVENFSEIAEELIQEKGGIMVENEEQLYVKLKEFFSNPDLIAFSGEKARIVVEKGKGALKRNIQIIKDFLNENSGD